MRQKFYYAIFRKKHFCFLMLTLFCNVWAFGQASKVTGKVIDEHSTAIPGVTVSIKGTSIGVSTAINGQFSLNAAPEAVLVFRLIGYETLEVSVGTQSFINVKLKPQAVGLSEVTVSYGKQKQREVTGSISTVNAAGLQDMPVMQFAQQLQGAAAGVSVVQSSGQPGRGVDFRIRGAASFFADNQPLFVIDGLPITGSINNINPDEIESYSILKDASATALYGSRAANGVILITTRHAKPGESKIEFNANYGIQSIPPNLVPKVMNAHEFATFMKERAEDATKYEPGYVEAADYKAAYDNPDQYGEGTNWFKLLTRKAPIQNYDLTIQSATERSSSTAIFGYQEQQGVLINTGTKIFTGRLNQDLTLGNGKLKVGFSIAPSYRLDHNNRTATGFASDGVGGLFERLFEASPLKPAFNPDGSYNRDVSSPGMVAYINPLAIFNLTNDDYKTTRILANGYINYEVLPGLLLKVNTGLDKGGETRQFYQAGLITGTAILPAPTGTSSSVDNGSYTAEGYVDYSKTFHNDHHIEVLGGYSVQRYSSTSNTLTGLGFPNDDITYLTAATSVTGNSSYTSYALLSTIGRINYNYKGKYLLQGAIRRDGSSRFGINSQYGTFPSVSAGWIISDEKFMQSFKNLDLLKIRASYGVTGNNFFSSNYQAQSTTSNYYYDFNGVITQGTSIGNLGNANLQWERSNQLDIGFDLSILKSRINLTYDYYHKISDHLIQARALPTSSGYTSVLDNVGKLALWGHEIGINTVNTTGKLKWNTSFNISFDRNIIQTLVDPGFIRRNNTVSSDYYRQQVGHHLGEFYGFVYLGLYKDAADLANSAKYQATATNPNGVSDIGTIKVKDINGDGVIDDVNDRTFIGDPTPTFTGGFTNNFRYKQFDFTINTAFSVGGQILNAAKWAYQTNMDGSRVPLAAALDHWRSVDNPGSGMYPRTKGGGTTALGRNVNSQWLESASYLSIKNVSLGYTVGLKDNSLLRSLRVYTSIQQLAVITGYSGFNPEINFSGQDPTLGTKVDENAYPIPRTISFGLSATFK